MDFSLQAVRIAGSFSIYNIIFGFILSYFVLLLITRGTGRARYFRLVPRLISFILFFLYELIKANMQVAWEVGTPKFHMTPGIIGVPLDVTADWQITLLANLITLTPGTLSLDISEDRKVLYVHSIYIHDREVFIRDIKNGFEKRIIEISS